jgi:hypothetical protein
VKEAEQDMERAGDGTNAQAIRQEIANALTIPVERRRSAQLLRH